MWECKSGWKEQEPWEVEGEEEKESEEEEEGECCHGSSLIIILKRFTVKGSVKLLQISTAL